MLITGFNPSQIISKVRKMLFKLGFELNNSKIHVINKSSNQSVTGITVNEKIQVSAKYRNKIRQEIYYIKKFGINSHLQRLNLDIKPIDYLNKIWGTLFS